MMKRMDEVEKSVCFGFISRVGEVIGPLLCSD